MTKTTTVQHLTLGEYAAALTVAGVTEPVLQDALNALSGEPNKFNVEFGATGYPATNNLAALVLRRHHRQRQRRRGEAR
jgi:hypothetical protein